MMAFSSVPVHNVQRGFILVFVFVLFFKGNNTGNIKSWRSFLYLGTDQILSWLYGELQHPGEGQPLERL